MNKLLLVEDDIGISNSLKLYLENSNFEVDIHSTGEGAVEKIISGEYSAIILDVNLPVMDGIEICKEVRIKSEIPILMLTARTSEMDKIEGLEIGADDYIPKPFSPRELLARINVILRRIPNLKSNNELLSIGDIEINTDKRLVSVNGAFEEFTKNEYEILLKIVEEDGTVVSRETLMTEVIGYDKYIYDRTLDTHIKNIRKKVQDKDLILTVRGQGYRLNK
ncbi:response regulator transcription factor [Candidatus Gracilibacteria bacterium]|nr:response regulator transcription factor [Candidatus Gracilibacteria bacterium]